MTSQSKVSEVRYVHQPSQGYYGEPDQKGGDRLRRVINVYRGRLYWTQKGVTDDPSNMWFWKRIWAQFPKNWTYPNGTTSVNNGFWHIRGQTVLSNTIAQAFMGVNMERYDFVYFKRRPGKIITKAWLDHILAEEGWKFDDHV